MANNVTTVSKQHDAHAPRCCECGCTHSSAFHYHHFQCALPGTIEYRMWNKVKIAKSKLRIFGPDDLLDMAHERREAGADMTAFDDALRRLTVRTVVKLCFLIRDKTARWLPREMRDMAKQGTSEAMFVNITSIDGEWPNITYQGILLNMPILINPHELQLRSEVRFMPKHIHSLFSRNDDVREPATLIGE